MGLTAPGPISVDHDVSGFDCGEDSLNKWLKKRAISNEKTGASRTFVVCNGNVVIGYYSLAAGAVAREETTGKVRRNMPEPVPVMILGRLAVDQQWQGQHIGRGMLKDAIMRTLIAAEQVGIRALLVHALSEEAKRFYLQYGFHKSPINDMTLMIALYEARRTISG